MAARVTPAAAKRVHQRWSEARFERRSAAFAADWVREHGRTVKHGPFAGMRYVPGHGSVPMLSGAYEAELHPVIEDWVAAAPQVIVDVGCSEGYYAVGLARAIPGATVYAFDIDSAARELCAQMAELNGVTERVAIEAECTPERLAQLPATGVHLLADCEGCELDLLDPAVVPPLRGWRILVELHDFIHPSISATIQRRFERSHDIRLIDEQPPGAVPELAGLPPSKRAQALDERRPERMRWADLRPKR